MHPLFLKDEIMAKYRVKQNYETAVVCTAAPISRTGDGRFDLSKCTQRDLKYLYEVINHPAVEQADDEQEKSTESPRKN